MDFSGGMEARAYFVGRELARMHEVTVISARIPDSGISQKIAGMNVYRVGLARKYSRTSIWPRILFVFAAIKQILKLGHQDLIEANGFWAYFPALIGSCFFHSKRVMIVADTVKDYTQDISSFLQKFLLFFEKQFISQNWDQIICISKTVKNKIIKLTRNKNVVSVIYCGVDANIINKITASRSKTRIITISRLVPYKRLNDLIIAFGILEKSFPNLNLDIIGTGEELSSLMQLAQSFEGKINFLGKIEKYTDVIKRLKKATVFCLPSIVEGFGIVTVEALACGTPVVLADISVNHEVTGNRGVLFFKPQDSGDLALKLRQILTQKNLYKKLQNEAEMVLKKYSWKEIGKTLEERYASLCAN